MVRWEVNTILGGNSETNPPTPLRHFTSGKKLYVVVCSSVLPQNLAPLDLQRTTYSSVLPKLLLYAVNFGSGLIMPPY